MLGQASSNTKAALTVARLSTAVMCHFVYLQHGIVRHTQLL